MQQLMEVDKDGEQAVATVSVLMVISGLAACAVLSAGITAPYGRYSRAGWGFLVSARTAWLVITLHLVLIISTWPHAC